MSADNWTVCPRCRARAAEAHRMMLQMVEDSYGKVPVEEFDAMRQKAAELETWDQRTFKEYYEFYGAEDGTVYADYRGSCSECQLAVKFTYEHEIEF